MTSLQYRSKAPMAISQSSMCTTHALTPSPRCSFVNTSGTTRTTSGEDRTNICCGVETSTDTIHYGTGMKTLMYSLPTQPEKPNSSSSSSPTMTWRWYYQREYPLFSI